MIRLLLNKDELIKLLVKQRNYYFRNITPQHFIKHSYNKRYVAEYLLGSQFSVMASAYRFCFLRSFMKIYKEIASAGITDIMYYYEKIRDRIDKERKKRK